MTEIVPGPARMAGRDHSIISTDYACVLVGSPNPSHFIFHCEKGAYNHHSISSSRSNLDEILQVSRC